MKKVSVVILNWNGQALLERFLPGVVAHTPADLAQVVVADNGSTDGSPDWVALHYPEVGLIRLDRNYGFAEGYNRAIAQVDTPYVLLLNDDVKVEEGWLEPMMAYMEIHPEVVACQPKILSLNQPDHFEHAGAAGGFIDRLGYPFCRGRIQSLVEEDRGQYDTETEVFWATGACLLVRRADYVEQGGLDARFFAHMEEIDLCWRLQSRGGRIVCLPQSKVWHLGGATLNGTNPRKTYLNFRNNLLMLYKNLPQERLASTLFLRTLLDGVAACFFLLKGEGAHFAAVFKARRDYHRMKRDYRGVRAEIQARATAVPAGQYSGVSIVDYFLKGRKRFSQLRFKC